MSDINMAILSGEVITKPEISYTKAGTALLKFKMKSKKLVGKYTNDYTHEITAWGQLAEEFQDLPISSRVLIQGYQTSRDWDKEGKIYTFYNTTAESLQRIDGAIGEFTGEPAPAPADGAKSDVDLPF
jgi:single-stranded DNA-binding protein